MPKKLKVGFVFDDSLDSNDGVAQYVRTLGGWLSTHGYSVKYLMGQTKARTWAGGEIYSLSKNLKVSFNQNQLSIPLPVRSAKIKEILDREKFDVLHVQMPHSPFLAQKIINAAKPNVAVVGTFHILPHGKLAHHGSKALRMLYGHQSQRFDEIISVSSPAAEFAQKVFGFGSRVVPNMVDISKFETNRPSQKSANPRIVFLGRLVKRKGILELLRAYNILHQSDPQVRLIIAGDGPLMGQIQKYVKKNGLADRVELLGKITEDDKPMLLAAADIACFPATGGESFGIVLLEAMAAGSKVVLAGNNPGYRSVLGDQPAALINVLDTADFAKQLSDFLDDHKLISRVHKWQSEAVRNYDVNIVGPKIELIYQAAIAKRSRVVA
ncbi:hypothetical protein A3F38_01510 [Candidatus Saccharibacteria bacterium RIFCSPHIGHO2_12_FULL_48_21]|nr:MAG: hypothetical protein A3F38_01510 [Candidatus Saccharibacteria bacterium RIFCSPHIGHO2_12_FULL_48_21]